MDFQMIYTQVAILFILIILGYVLGKLQIITQEMIESLTKFILKIGLPALILSGMTIKRTPEKFGDSVLTLFIACGVYAVSFAITKLTTKIIKPKKSYQGVLEFSLMFSNVAFMGIPVTRTILGEEATFYAVIFNIVFNILVYSLGVVLVSSDKEGDKQKIDFKKTINPAVIASLVGFVIFLSGIMLPEIIKEPAALLGSTTTPISMIVTGAMLSTLPASQMFSNWRIYIVSLVRLIILPLVVFVILKYLVKIDSPILMGVPILLTGMPVAASAALVTQEYGSEPQVASQCVFISTLISVLTIPLLALLFI